jgi:hypothetical protein
MVEQRFTRRDDDDGLHGVVEEIVEHRAELCAAVVGDGGEQGEVAVRPGGFLDGGQGAGRPVQGGADGDHPDETGPVGDQGAGGPVAPVAELVDGGLDPLAGGLADLGGAVDDPGDGLVGHPGHGGDLRHGGVLGAAHGPYCPTAAPALRTRCASGARAVCARL